MFKLQRKLIASQEMKNAGICGIQVGLDPGAQAIFSGLGVSAPLSQLSSYSDSLSAIPTKKDLLPPKFLHNSQASISLAQPRKRGRAGELRPNQMELEGEAWSPKGN